MSDARPYIGGQAVLEGVMMRAPKSFAVVVRRRDGSLRVRERAMDNERRGVARWPLVRGVASLVESLRLGSEALRFSAEQVESDLASEAGSRTLEESGPKHKRGSTSSRGGSLGVLGAFGLSLFALATTDDGRGVDSGASGGRRAGSLVMLAVAIAFFVALPQAATAGVNRLLHLGLPVQSGAFQAVTGAFKLAIVVGYLLAMRRVPEIRRVFQYHGAEHKTISTYEADEPLTVERAREKTTMHPRCGTTFLVMIALVSILVFVAMGRALPRIETGNALADNVVFFALKLPFLPVIAAVTFELQRFFARHFSAGPLRVLLWPGFLVQKITTAEPDDAQLEVALASLRVTLFRQEGGGSASDVGRSPSGNGRNADVAFPSYEALVAAPALRPAAR
jgi:uncharacterized protein YqhQ